MPHLLRILSVAVGYWAVQSLLATPAGMEEGSAVAQATQLSTILSAAGEEQRCPPGLAKPSHPLLDRTNLAFVDSGDSLPVVLIQAGLMYHLHHLLRDHYRHYHPQQALELV